MIYNPLEEYDKKFKAQHLTHANAFFENLVKKSAVNVEENRSTVAQYNKFVENLNALKKKLKLWKVLRILMCITLILIPLVILKLNPKIKALRNELAHATEKANELLSAAYTQMEPLNRLFTENDAIRIIEKTIPDLSFADCFTVEQEQNMVVNFDFPIINVLDISTIDVLSGNYNGNPFLFENRLIHSMGTHTYHGYKTITWTERYRDSDGKTRTRTRSQTLHATVTKPMPYYATQNVLHYCAQGGPELSFSRDATHLEQKSERQLEKYIEKGEKRLDQMNDEAIKSNDDFMSMSNTDFEVLFDALNRTHEVQFRALFTPLAQTNMVDLILSKVGYGDDFHFFKNKRTNTIITNHSQNRNLLLNPTEYRSYSFDIIKEKFTYANAEFFRAVYFDFAPLLAIPMYQDKPVHSLKPIPDYIQTYSYRECESISNRVNRENIVHPRTKTNAILKSTYLNTKNGIDEICVDAYSYDIEGRVDFVSVFGGDGRFHSVAVPWDEYLPLQAKNYFYVSNSDTAPIGSILARKNNICIYK